MLFARHSSNELGAQRPYDISLTAVGEEGEKERKKRLRGQKVFRVILCEGLFLEKLIN